ARASLDRRCKAPSRHERKLAMQYALLIHGDETSWPRMSQAEQAAGMAAYMAYTEALSKAGVLRGGERLRPSSSSTTVRLVDGKSQVLDGPYAESKEQLGGFYLIEVADLDAALGWAARCPGAAYGTIEVRPIWMREDYLSGR